MEQNKNDSEIYNACERIRLFLFMDAGGAIMANQGNKVTTGLIEQTRKGSLIECLISGHYWKPLFENKEWLGLLELAQNLNAIDYAISSELRTIIEFFPQETEGYIFIECIPTN